MEVLSVNGGPPTLAAGVPILEGRFGAGDGTVLAVGVPGSSIALQAEAAIVIVGLAFALLAAAVLLRRPAAPAARLFAVFGGLAAVALGVAPAAGGPHPIWALLAQFVTFLALAASLPAFAIALVGNWKRPRRFLRLHWLAAGVLLAAYLFAVLYRPATYSVVRVAFGLFLAASIVGAIALLGVRAAGRQDRPGVAEARLALTGIACGALPFVALTLVPLTLGYHELVPWSITACLSGIIPATFAYAILRRQLLGIRRLVHRGMVYSITACGLLVLIAYLANGARLFLGERYASGATVVIVVLGALLFDVARNAARRLLDRLVYREQVDSQALLADVKQDLAGASGAGQIAEAMVGRLRHDLALEAAVLFFGSDPRGARVAASAGDRSLPSIAFIQPRLPSLAFDPDGLTEVRWDSDELVVVRLQASNETVGWLVLGPKDEGEVFVHDERLLIATVAPILALAIRETTLVSELRDVSRRLINAEESERTRIACDLHDGPLQKAILLGGIDGNDVRDANGVARELVAELRELCARLRPAILDDLGLVPALDWLLEQASRQFAVMPSLTLCGMTEEDRLSPDAEIALFRVTQEAVTNAVKHGQASAIHVSLARRDDGLELCISDDGRGFASAEGIPRGLGIPGMRERLRQVGGGVSVASDNGRGTVVTAFIPHLRAAHA
jgi:signal transduction histidine kinase